MKLSRLSHACIILALGMFSTSGMAADEGHGPGTSG